MRVHRPQAAPCHFVLATPALREGSRRSLCLADPAHRLSPQVQVLLTMGSCHTLPVSFPGIKGWWSMKSAGHVMLPKSPARKAAKKRAAKSPVGPQPKLALDAAAKNAAIATELAPAVAIALLEKSEQLPGKPPPALDVLAVGVVPSETDGNVRVQLLFENGSVLPVEMSEAAGSALSDALSDERPKAKKQPSKRKA